MWQYLPLMLGEVAISAAILVTASLHFTKWVIARQDRIDEEIESEALSDEVWKLKHDTLIEQRKDLAKRWSDRSHVASEAREISERIEAVDRELLRIGPRPAMECSHP